MSAHDQRLAPFEPVIARLREDALTVFGARVTAFEPRRTFVGPFSRVLEVQVPTADGPMTAFIKILIPRATTAEELQATERNVSREYAALRRACDTLAAHDGLSAARPLACYPELFALVTEGASGVPLTHLLANLRGTPSSSTREHTAAVMRNVGRWLAAFQASPDISQPPVSRERMRQYLDVRLNTLVQLRVCGPELRDALLRFFDRRAQTVDSQEWRAVPVHADFTPANVMVAGTKVTVIDFTMTKHGARYLDVSHMFMHVEMLKARPWFRPGVIDHQTAALLDAFEPGLRIDRPLVELLLVQHVVSFMLQTAQMKISRIPSVLLAWHVRRRQLKWLAARARSA